MLSPTNQLMFTSSNSSEPDHGFQIAPMVDVVFVLLLFFMALAGVRQIEKQMSVNLPAGGEGGHFSVVIDISAEGEVLGNGKSLVPQSGSDLAGLRQWLRAVADSDGGAPVVIRPAASATHERFLQVLATLQEVGLRKITFA